jgi:phosphatidate cytidylyltransferase
MTDTVVGFEDVVAAEGIGRVRARASGDLIARVVTAVILITALGASLIWQPVLAIFALVVFVLGASEFYTSLVRANFKPIGIFGFIGIIGASVGAYYWGSLAIPVAFIVAVALLLLYYAVVPGKVDPLGNLALTITVMVWVGLGAYTMLIVVSDSYRPLVMGVVVTVAAMDIAQYFIGRAIGRTPLSPWVSPKKTVEGLVAGVFVAMMIGALLHFVQPFELTSGLALGAAVAILAPLGDLAMSAAKRSLGLKDMGSVLPGHGGFLDRIDGLLFVIPAAWVVFLWAGIL